MRVTALLGLAISSLSIACDKAGSADGAPIIEDKPLEARETKHQNGQVKERFTVTKDASGSFVKHGKYEWFYPNGQKGEEGTYSDGTQVGAWTQWHDNGKIEQKSLYKAGKLDGEASRYSAEGVLVSSLRYRDGKLNGPAVLHIKGKPVLEGSYADGAADGTWILRDRAGLKTAEVQLNKGRFIGKILHATPREPVSPESSCDVALGARLGESRYADVKLGSLERGVVPAEMIDNPGPAGGSVVVFAGEETGLEHVKKAYFVFDKSGTLVSSTLVMPKNRPTKYGPGFNGYFKVAKEDLAEKYQLVEQRVPFVGNSFARFQSSACVVTLDAPHLSFDMTVNYHLKGREDAVINITE